MKTYTYTVNKEQFEALKAMNHAEQMRYLEDEVLNPCITMGYGFYGCGRLTEADGNYGIEITTGDTCD